MDVDIDVGVGTKEKESPPECPPAGQRLVDILNRVEERIEKLRKDASQIEEEKENLLSALDAIKHSEWIAQLSEPEQEYIKHSVSRLLAHCMTVETAIRTNRNQQQEESLYKVNEFIDNLVIQLRNDPVAACERCHIFIKTCSFGSSDSQAKSFMIDANFESAVLGCTLDDQKRIKKRLQGLLDYFTGVQFIEM